MAKPPRVLAQDLAPPPETVRKSPTQFLKLKPGDTQHVTILSHTFTGGVTHYARGRMKLHHPTECPFCAGGQKPRWYAWLHVWTERTNRAWIVQLASSQHGALLAARERWTDLRGCEAELKRDGRAANTPLTISFTAAPNPQPHHPDPIDIAATLTAFMEWTTGEAGNQTRPEPLKKGKT